jgi:hypothetical protein
MTDLDLQDDLEEDDDEDQDEDDDDDSDDDEEDDEEDVETWQVLGHGPVCAQRRLTSRTETA